MSLTTRAVSRPVEDAGAGDEKEKRERALDAVEETKICSEGEAASAGKDETGQEWIAAAGAAAEPEVEALEADAPESATLSAVDGDDTVGEVDLDAPAAKGFETAEEETFKLNKKRLELIIEEKEWELEEAGQGEERMVKIIEYVNAVEAYKELCSAQVPNTVSDLLEQYVQVCHLRPGDAGFDEGLAFLGLNNRENVINPGGSGAGFEVYFETQGDVGAQHDEGDDSDDDSDDDDDGINPTIASAMEGIVMAVAQRGFDPSANGIHLAQDVDGRWRWLEDDLGRSLDEKPPGDFRMKVMSIEEMVSGGLNVNSLHEEVDPLELMDFSECKTWEDAMRVSREASAALDHMKADGWEVDTRSWCNEEEHLLVVKELRPLRTMSHVEGTTFEDDENGELAAGGSTAATAGAAAAAAFATAAEENSCLLSARADDQMEDSSAADGSEVEGQQKGHNGDSG